MVIHHKVRGEGEPLLLIHGLFGSLENLGGIARTLGESFSVYSIDLPNHGRSAHTDETSLEAMAEQVYQWMSDEGLDCAHLVGHSLGGKVAMELALHHPERVKHLVVMDIAPVHYDPHHNQVFQGLLDIDLASITKRSDAEAVLAQSVEELPVRSFLLKNLVKEPEAGFSWRMNLPVIHEGYSQLIKENSAHVFDGKTLFLKGGNSEYIQEHHREDILKRFPNVNLKIVANTGHWLHAEKPDIVARLINKFLSSSTS